jgi:hypothetical protein
MTESKPTVLGAAEQDRSLIEEARLARLQAEEAVQRVQHRIERLAHLSEASDRLRNGNDGREQSVGESKPAPGARRPD